MLNHLLTRSMFAGVLDILMEVGNLTLIRIGVLLQLVPCITAALQAYQTRAAQCGQSFTHMVLLEAAVQGWYTTALLLSGLNTALLTPACPCGKKA